MLGSRFRRRPVLTSVSPGWTRAQRGLHWWTATLIVVTFPLGFLMAGLPTSLLLLKFLLYQLHKSLGITVIILAVIRLAVRIRLGRPPWPRMPAWQRHAASWAHSGLYGLLLIVPILGYFTAASAPAEVPTLFFGIPVPHVIGPDPALFAVLRSCHKTASITLAVLASGHAVVALHHYLAGRTSFFRTPL
jgi:cytochrome b561